MALIVVGSAKGAPGVSTTALALAAAWPGEQVPVVVEADPWGGDALARFGLLDSPSLVTLAAAARRAGLAERLVYTHAQLLLGGVPVVAAPAVPAQSSAALGVLEEHWPDIELGQTVMLADVGRMGPSLGPVGNLVAAADLAVLVTRGAIEDLAHAEAAVPRLRAVVRRVAVVVVGQCGWSAVEVGQVLGADVCWQLPFDARSARVLRGAPAERRLPPWRRFPLLDAAGRLAEAVGALVPASEASEPAATESAGDGLAAMLGGERP
ncbi:hypothetical protein [Kitasatospora sp. NBC_01266]|uniref:hypothetical protein n=1 Tax=Kitasatospora sp. NBC_01266 TaxID=2903572 RepID=UPI002E320AEC|nr:hypothetical protein [Kitasatospora sp. NBC_01266]